MPPTRSPCSSAAQAISAAVRAASTDLNVDLAAEVHGGGLVHKYQYRTLFFFLEQLGVCNLCSSGDAPVDGANIIARLVDTHFREVDTATTKIRGQQSRQWVGGFVVGKVGDFPRRIAQADKVAQVSVGAAIFMQRSQFTSGIYAARHGLSSGSSNSLDQNVENLIGIDTHGFCLEANDNAMAEHVMQHSLHIIR